MFWMGSETMQTIQGEEYISTNYEFRNCCILIQKNSYNS
jgi:hypothetical protein